MENYEVIEDGEVIIDDRMTAKRQANNLLVVDDSAFIRKLIESTLRTSGYNVIAAKDGADAYEMLQEFELVAEEENLPVSDLVSMVISDVEMPRMDGLHLVKRLRDGKAYRTTPIVMFSSIMSEENRHKALSLGANDTMTKPEIGKLVGLVDGYLL